MDEIIKTSDGRPFSTEKIAAMRGGVLKKDGIETEVIPVEGGFALKVTERKQIRKRVPLHKRNILTAGKRDPNYEYRFVNNDDGRIEQYEDAGWELVSNGTVGDDRAGKDHPVGSATSKAVGGGKTAYLMRKKKEWFDEDYAAKQAINDKSEHGLVEQAAQGRYGKIQVNKTKFNGEY